MEHEPFLPDERHSSQPSRQPSQEHEASDESRLFEFTRHPRFFGCLFALKFFIQFTTGLIELPLVRLVERAACRDHVGSARGSHDEIACKIPPVQNKLALILGYKWAFDSLPCKLCSAPSVSLQVLTGVGLLTAIFYGPVANSRGRRIVMAIAVTGQLLALYGIMIVCTSKL